MKPPAACGPVVDDMEGPEREPLYWLAANRACVPTSYDP